MYSESAAGPHVRERKILGLESFSVRRCQISAESMILETSSTINREHHQICEAQPYDWRRVIFLFIFHGIIMIMVCCIKIATDSKSCPVSHSVERRVHSFHTMWSLCCPLPAGRDDRSVFPNKHSSHGARPARCGNVCSQPVTHGYHLTSMSSAIWVKTLLLLLQGDRSLRKVETLTLKIRSSASQTFAPSCLEYIVEKVRKT